MASGCGTDHAPRTARVPARAEVKAAPPATPTTRQQTARGPVTSREPTIHTARRFAHEFAAYIDGARNLPSGASLTLKRNLRSAALRGSATRGTAAHTVVRLVELFETTQLHSQAQADLMTGGVRRRLVMKLDRQRGRWVVVKITLP